MGARYSALLGPWALRTAVGQLRLMARSGKGRSENQRDLLDIDCSGKDPKEHDTLFVDLGSVRRQPATSPQEIMIS
jgi:hypothetical protein